MTISPGAGEPEDAVGSSEIAEPEEHGQAERERRTKAASLVCGSVLSLESLGLGALALTNGHSPLWLLLLVPMLFLGLLTIVVGVDTKPDEVRPGFWPGTILTLGAGATTALMTFHTISGWFSALALPLAFLGFGFFIPEKVGEAKNEDIDADPGIHDAIPEQS
jgi:hypothetical protein